jgi:Protein of unknown function (DUF1569)
MHSCLHRVQKEIDDGVRGLSLEHLAWHREGKWSAAAILEHLSLTYSGTAKGLQRALDSGRPNITPASARQRVVSFVVTVLRFMPPGRQAPAMVVPKGAPPQTVLADLRRNLIAADEALSRCEARFGAGIRIANHPSLGPLTALQWRIFHLVHARHHIKQIARIRTQIAGEAPPARAHG